MARQGGVSDPGIEPLPPERCLYMQRAAAQALQVLRRFGGDAVDYDPATLQLLDEWIDRVGRTGPLPASARVLVIAFLGQTFLSRYGGYWATRRQGARQTLGVVCPVAGSLARGRFIDIVEQAGRRLLHGIRDSLAFYFLSVSVDLQGRS